MDFNAIFAVAVFLIVIALVMSEKVHRSLVATWAARPCCFSRTL